MRNKAILVAVATLFSTTLTGCGGGGGGDAGDYCDTLKDSESNFEDLASAGNFDGFDEALDKMHELADDAPDEIKGDWEVFDKAFTDLEQALEDADMTMSDLEGMSDPSAVDPEKLAGLMEAAAPLSSEEFATAAENIEKHAKDECGIDFTGGS